MIIRFNGTQANLVNGCNSYSATYTAKDDGSISFGPFIGTRKFCENDFDNLYTKALADSLFYQSIGNQIILKNANQTNSIILTIFQADFVNFTGRYSTNLPDSDLIV